MGKYTAWKMKAAICDDTVENERRIKNYGKTYQFESTWNPAVFHGNRSGIYEKPDTCAGKYLAHPE